MDLLLNLSPMLLKHVKPHLDFYSTDKKESSLVQVHYTDSRRALKKVHDYRLFLNRMSHDSQSSLEDLTKEKLECDKLSRLVFALDKTISTNVVPLLSSKNARAQGKGLTLNGQCITALKYIHTATSEMPTRWQKKHQKMITNRGLLSRGEQIDPPQNSVGQSTSPEDINKQLQKFQSNLSNADEDMIDGYCLEIFHFMVHFTDPTTGTLKKLTAQEVKNFGKWSNLFDQTFDRYAQIPADKESCSYLQSMKKILDVFDKTLFEIGKLNVLVKFLQSLGKPHFQEYRSELTDKLISIFTHQLKGLNGIIEKKANNNSLLKLEQGYKSKLVDAINKLLPDWQPLNNEAYLKLLSDLLIKDDESYWFDLIFTLTHHASSQSHLLSSDQWQQAFLAKLEDHDPDARQMLAAICHQNPSAALQVATDNHRLLWLKALLYNQADDHQGAYETITRVEERCNELGLTPEPRLQLEIARIKLASLKATATCDEPQPDDLHLIIKQLDRLSAVPEGCNKFNPSALEQLTPWTRQEIRQVEELKAEVLALKKASGRASQVQPAQETDEPPVQEMASPVVFQPSQQSPEAICRNILKHLQPRHYHNRAEAMVSDDTFMVVASNGKPLSVTDAMKQDNWNRRISPLLDQVLNHRSDGAFIDELVLYQEFLTSKTEKQNLGVHRLILELSWTLMRHAERALAENTMTPTEVVTLLDYAWEFMLLSVHRAMRRSGPLPEHLSDEQLVTTVTEWLQSHEDPETKAEMEFFMRCALGSTAGHINGFRAELLPAKREHLEQRAAHFFQAKHRLQPGYIKPENDRDWQVRSVCMLQPQSERWLR